MKFKIVLDKWDIENMSTQCLADALKHFNNEKTQAYFERHGNQQIEIVIERKEDFNDLCKSVEIKHFEKRENYLEWLLRKNDTKK